MKQASQFPKIVVLIFVVAGLGMIASRWLQSPVNAVKVDVMMPQLSALALEGEKLFDANCAKCHGKNASGTDKGPPLVHKIYNPGHHSDGSFLLAATRGVRQHHWPYGDMPKQPQVTGEQITAIVKYVRELQVANGIASRSY